MIDSRLPISRRSALTTLGAAAAIGVGAPAIHAFDDARNVKPAAANWPWWRGPSWNGRAVGAAPPFEWSETKNVVWKTQVSGQGHATPCIWGKRIFLAAAEEANETQSLACFERDTGRRLWRTQIHAGGFMPKHKKNSHASATPACDGELVFGVFYRDESIWATAVDFDGQIRWQVKVGAYNDRYGYGSSPTILGKTLIVAGDSPAAGFLVALDRATGEQVWRAKRPNLTSYGPPVVANFKGGVQIVLQGNQVAGYDPRSGREKWRCQAPARATACTLCFDDRRVYSSGGYPERRLYCIAADGAGDVTSSHIKWRHERKSSVAYVPSPVLADGRLYVISDGGLATCLRTEDGLEHWTKRLGGDFSASPVLIGEHLIAPNETGKTFVLKASDKYQLVAENTLGDEGVFASPIVCGGRLFLRTTERLYCIGS